MILLDSNIIIDATKIGAEALRRWIAEDFPAVSIITYVEVLGFHQINQEDRDDLGAFFAAICVLPITNEVADQAVKLRQTRRMSLGDALIASTALVHRTTLVTRNISDFAWVNGLVLVDPARTA